MIKTFIDITETLRNKLPFSMYSKIIHTDTSSKLSLLKEYVKS